MTTNVFRAFLLVFLMAGIAACDKGQTPAGGESQKAGEAQEAAPAGGAEPVVKAEPDSAPAEVAESEPGADDAEQPQSRRQERDPEVDMAQMIHDVWWNSPDIYAALDLSAEQRGAMDSSLTEYVDAQWLRTEATPQLMEQYRAAVGERNFDEAQRLSNEMADIAGKGMSANFDLQLAVLGQMNEEQLDKAIADYPGMMARQWVRGRRVMGGQQLGRNPGAERGPAGAGMGQGERRMGQGQGERRQGQGQGQGKGQGQRRRQGQGQGEGEGEGEGDGNGDDQGEGGGDG